MEWLRNKWFHDNCFTVNCVGRAGGLALLWMNEVNLEIASYSLSHIDAKVNSESEGDRWRFSGFYGHFETQKRPASWNLLRLLHYQIALPWLCVGAFNEIM